VVFGGVGSGVGSDNNKADRDLEYLNGTATAWVTKPLKYSRFSHAMVLLPCP
jgi:hypothetical protein